MLSTPNTFIQRLLHDLETERGNLGITLPAIRSFYGRFVNYFQNCTKVDDQIPTLVSCTFHYIECIENFLEDYGDLTNSEASDIMQYISILSDMAFIEEVKDKFMKLISNKIMEKITLSRVPFLIKELIKHFIFAYQNIDHNFLIIIAESNKYYLCKLIANICKCGDYRYQSLALELIFRLCRRAQLTRFVIDFFPKSTALQSAFLQINPRDFDKDSRVFLNIINKEFKSVFSVTCKHISLGEVIIRPPQRLDGILWIDFNLGPKTISIICDNEQNSPSDEYELITIEVSDISNAQMSTRLDNTSECIVITFNLTAPCTFAFCQINTAEEARILELNVLTCPDQLYENILPQLFGEKFKVIPFNNGLEERFDRKMIRDAICNTKINSVTTKSKKREYKPLKIFQKTVKPKVAMDKDNITSKSDHTEVSSNFGHHLPTVKSSNKNANNSNNNEEPACVSDLEIPDDFLKMNDLTTYEEEVDTILPTFQNALCTSRKLLRMDINNTINIPEEITKLHRIMIANPSEENETANCLSPKLYQTSEILKMDVVKIVNIPEKSEGKHKNVIINVGSALNIENKKESCLSPDFDELNQSSESLTMDINKTINISNGTRTRKNSDITTNQEVKVNEPNEVVSNVFNGESESVKYNKITKNVELHNVHINWNTTSSLCKKSKKVILINGKKLKPNNKGRHVRMSSAKITTENKPNAAESEFNYSKIKHTRTEDVKADDLLKEFDGLQNNCSYSNNTERNHSNIELYGTSPNTSISDNEIKSLSVRKSKVNIKSEDDFNKKNTTPQFKKLYNPNHFLKLVSSIPNENESNDCKMKNADKPLKSENINLNNSHKFTGQSISIDKCPSTKNSKSKIDEIKEIFSKSKKNTEKIELTVETEIPDEKNKNVKKIKVKWPNKEILANSVNNENRKRKRVFGGKSRNKKSLEKHSLYPKKAEMQTGSLLRASMKDIANKLGQNINSAFSGKKEKSVIGKPFVKLYDILKQKPLEAEECKTNNAASIYIPKLSRKVDYDSDSKSGNKSSAKKNKSKKLKYTKTINKQDVNNENLHVSVEETSLIKQANTNEISTIDLQTDHEVAADILYNDLQKEAETQNKDMITFEENKDVDFLSVTISNKDLHEDAIIHDTLQNSFLITEIPGTNCTGVESLLQEEMPESTERLKVNSHIQDNVEIVESYKKNHIRIKRIDIKNKKPQNSIEKNLVSNECRQEINEKTPNTANILADHYIDHQHKIDCSENKNTSNLNTHKEGLIQNMKRGNDMNNPFEDENSSSEDDIEHVKQTTVHAIVHTECSSKRYSSSLHERLEHNFSNEEVAKDTSQEIKKNDRKIKIHIYNKEHLSKSESIINPFDALNMSMLFQNQTSDKESMANTLFKVPQTDSLSKRKLSNETQNITEKARSSNISSQKRIKQGNQKNNGRQLNFFRSSVMSSFCSENRKTKDSKNGGISGAINGFLTKTNHNEVLTKKRHKSYWGKVLKRFVHMTLKQHAEIYGFMSDIMQHSQNSFIKEYETVTAINKKLKTYTKRY